MRTDTKDSISNRELDAIDALQRCKAKSVSGPVTPTGGDGKIATMQSPPGTAKIKRYEFRPFERCNLLEVA